jgi:hypothetical protein
MARADLLISLVKAATGGDRAMVNKTVEAMVAEERAKKHTVLAEQLEKQVHRNGLAPKADYIPARTSAHDVVHELSPRLTLGDLILDPSVRLPIELPRRDGDSATKAFRVCAYP